MHLDQVDRRPRTDAITPIGPRNKELAHVEIDRPPAVRMLVQQRKPRQRAAHADEPHRAVRLRPVIVQLQHIGKPAIFAHADLAIGRKEVVEVVNVELGEVLQRFALRMFATFE